MKSRLLILFISFLFFGSLNAQVLNHRLGEILVKLDDHQNVKQFLAKYSNNSRSTSNISDAQCLSKGMNIYRLKFDFRYVDEIELLKEIQRDEKVIMAQFNHLLEYRNTPNDPLFSSQWQYIGLNGGVEGIDIDADLAWDITTGGVTVDGDTIVVCIIDGGIDLEHEDFGDNIWINKDEIAGDGIDNDGNGYVDDVRGWDVAANNDNVDGSTHGTQVAGIVGAQGNNGIGVAGVNWDVKMMIVRGGGDEAAALAAYAYPYTMRKMYNETNGEKGAFVVTTNASWGTDMGKAEDAPIWCSFYDSLGVVGILSCGATVNANFDVEVVGDLPTQCSSEYLIAVTNIDMNDEKVVAAGYGATSIDLGAFGEGTFTAAQGNNYSGFGGTSGATPHVAGAIALLYSAPCSDFIDLVKSDPAQAALNMRSYILNGVDHNESLVGITTTEGRLNVNNSLELLMNSCSECQFPYGLESNFLNIDDIELSWKTFGSDISQTDLQWRIAGESAWNDEANVTSPYILNDVVECTIYEYRLKSICSGAQSEYSKSAFVSTEVLPTNLNVGAISENEISVTWSNPSLLRNSFSLELFEVGDTNAVFMISSDDLDASYTFSNLKSCTDYEVKLISSCTINPSETILALKTRGCGSCIDLDYCKPVANSNEEWIDSLQIGETIIFSGNNNGYYLNEEVSFEFTRGQQVEVKIMPGFSGTEYTDKVSVWLDVNRDGAFDNEDYVVQGTYSKNSGFVSLMVDIPDDMESGSTRMRVILSFDVREQGCEDFDYGETEDYCVMIQDCFFDTKSLGIEIDENSAILSWSNPGNLGLSLNYRQFGVGADWTNIDLTDNSVTLDGLKVCTTYEIQFNVKCDADATPYALPITYFKTDCESGIQEIVNISEMRLQPNPVDIQLNLDFYSSISSDCNWTIYDINGKEIISNTNVKILQGKNVIAIPIHESISNGVYFLQLRNDTFVKTMKFIKL